MKPLLDLARLRIVPAPSTWPEAEGAYCEEWSWSGRRGAVWVLSTASLGPGGALLSGPLCLVVTCLHPGSIPPEVQG